jgi:hypothetical protein
LVSLGRPGLLYLYQVLRFCRGVQLNALK